MKKNIVAIVQARMSSSRLPGKALADIEGKPMLVRVIDRVKFAKTINKIVVATTIDPSDNTIADLCETNKYNVFRGSIHDVLDRYYQAAKEHKADIIVRLCADSPLIDAGLIDEVVSDYLSADPPVDYASNRIVRTYPVGLDTEVFSFSSLDNAWHEAKSMYQREHVTPYMYEPGSPCTLLSVIGKAPTGRYRWTVDTQEDLELIRKIYKHFEGRNDFSWLEVIDLMKWSPELANINKDIRQKAYKEYEIIPTKKTNNTSSIVVVIPAIKKKVMFTNDLVKQLAGISLIQRAIEKAKSIEISNKEIFVITDSDEISLIAKRNEVGVLYKKELGSQDLDLIDAIKSVLASNNGNNKDVMILSPYFPLLDVEEIYRALSLYKADRSSLIMPVMLDNHNVYAKDERLITDITPEKNRQEIFVESAAFQILNGKHFFGSIDRHIKTKPFKLNQNLTGIYDYRDWWVCEKLLKRKKIVFRVIGGGKFGLGHICRSLELAQTIIDHEVRFVCDLETKPVADKLVGYLYWLGIYDKNEIEDKIISLRPDMVINDILNTDKKYITRLKDRGIKVVNFEDLGSGAQKADLTINELYDKKEIAGNNILWGHDYYFVRDEFDNAKIHRFRKQVKCLLITFGGADPSDFTRRVLRSVIPFCRREKIKIMVVTGEGYLYIDELNEEISRIEGVDIEYTHSTGVMSFIMEQTEIAITSNGRTVYELAHMSIPAIILSHHARENTHCFAREENGFIPIGIYNGRKKEKQMLDALKRLVHDGRYRRSMFDRMKHYRFNLNKNKVKDLILRVLESR